MIISQSLISKDQTTTRDVKAELRTITTKEKIIGVAVAFISTPLWILGVFAVIEVTMKLSS